MVEAGAAEQAAVWSGIKADIYGTSSSLSLFSQSPFPRGNDVNRIKGMLGSMLG